MAYDGAIPVSQTKQPRKWLRRFARYSMWTLGGFAVALLAAHLIWKYSGSGQWQLEINRDGIQVYGLKAPGWTLKKYKGVRQLRTTLNRAVAGALDSDLATCVDWIGPGCVSLKTIDAWNPSNQSVVYLTRVDLPSPFTPREFLLRTRVTQNPSNAAVLIEFIAVPDRLPLDPCCMRVKDVRNTWLYTPVGNGDLKVEYTEDSDYGMPYVLYDIRHATDVYDMLTALPQLLNKDKYNSTRFDFITASE